MRVTLCITLSWMVALLLLIVSVVVFIQQKRFFTSAPKDIQEAIIERKERFFGAHLIGYIIMVIAIVLFLGGFVYAIYNGRIHQFQWIDYFVRFMIMFYGLSLFDIVFLDWFLLTKSHFYQHYFPETEGCKGYANFGFNRKEQVTKLIAYPFVCMVLAFLCTL